jgi:hypothetical protein
MTKGNEELYWRVQDNLANAKARDTSDMSEHRRFRLEYRMQFWERFIEHYERRYGKPQGERPPLPPVERANSEPVLQFRPRRDLETIDPGPPPHPKIRPVVSAYEDLQATIDTLADVAYKQGRTPELDDALARVGDASSAFLDELDRLALALTPTPADAE